MARIDRIVITHHQLHLEPPFPASWDSRPRTRFPATLVRVFDEDGGMGVGSGDAMLGFGDYEHLFIGQEAMALDRHHAVLMNIEFHAGRPWPLDIALWDLAGKTQGQAVWKMLGGNSPRLRAYQSSGVHRSTDDMVGVATRCLAAGIPALKVRFGRSDLAADLAVLQAIREAVGDQLDLMVDCNQGWRMPWDTAPSWDFEHALQVAKALEKLHVFWIEEPLHRGDYEGMRALRKRVGIRLAGAEFTREPYEWRELLERDCLDVFQPDAVLTGGISGLAPFARQVAERGRLFSSHTWGNGLGMMANLQLIAGTAGETYVEWPLDGPDWTPERRDYLLKSPLGLDSQGWFTLPDAPGLGVELNEVVLEQTLSKTATFN